MLITSKFNRKINIKMERRSLIILRVANYLVVDF